MLEVGVMAPDFTLLDQNDTEVTLSGLRGRWVALWFYPKAATPGCTKEGQCFRDLSGDFAAAGVEILGISFDTTAENKAFAEAEGFGFRLLSDPEKEAGEAYDAVRGEDDPYAGYPKRVTYVIDPRGTVRHTYDVGADIPSHPATVLTDIKASAAR